LPDRAPVEIIGARSGNEPASTFTPAPDRGPRDYAAGRPERSNEPRPAFYEAGGVPMVWYKTSVGRKNKADPKWLLPLICRLGSVTKREVGAIRITDNETRFQITEAASEAFMTAIRDAGENEIRIEQADGPPTEAHKPREFSRARSARPEGGDRPDYARAKPRFKADNAPRSYRKRSV
jgi:ATP-dependent RNA helicase DeaD